MSKPLLEENSDMPTILVHFPEIKRGGTWYCPEEIHGLKEYCYLSCGACWAKALETMEVKTNE